MKSAITLVEVLVSTVVLIFLLAGIFSILNVADKIWNFDMGLVDLQQQARQATHGMIREIRQSSAGNIDIDTGGQAIIFSIPDISSAISYELSGGKLIREHPEGQEQILADYASSLNFCCRHASVCDENCANAHSVEIQLGVTKNVRGKMLDFSLTEKVKLRND